MRQFIPRLLSLLFVTAALVECGVPGIPKPPSLDLPQPVADLRAVRKGDSVYLDWTVPTETTDRLPSAALGCDTYLQKPGCRHRRLRIRWKSPCATAAPEPTREPNLRSLPPRCERTTPIIFREHLLGRIPMRRFSTQFPFSMAMAVALESRTSCTCRLCRLCPRPSTFGLSYGGGGCAELGRNSTSARNAWIGTRLSRVSSSGEWKCGYDRRRGAARCDTTLGP